MDGALLTSDVGLVHARWKVTYKFDDVASFVTQIAGDEVETAEDIIRTYVETTGIAIAGEMTAEELIRTRVDDVQQEMRARVNERLVALHSGVVVTLVEMLEPTPPLQIREAFDGTQRAENLKQQRVRQAEKGRTQLLNETAGAAFPRLVQLLSQMDDGGTADRSVAQLREELDQVLEDEAEGEAGQAIKEAGTYRATLVSQMQSDVARYRMLIPEYQRNPTMLINRLWEQTKTRIFNSTGVIKILRPRGLKEFRLLVPLDPEQKRIQEQQRLSDQEFDIKKLRPEQMKPLGWEHD